jgi:hypothetical protein
MEHTHEDHALPGGALNDTRLNLKALRLATHGWNLGNPLIYKPAVSDLRAIARELANAGSPSGALALNDTQTVGDVQQHAEAHGVLILRPAAPPAQVGLLAARCVAEVAEVALGRACAVQGQWDVVLPTGDEQSTRYLCRVSVEAREDVTLVELRFALDQLWAAGWQVAQPATEFFARADWREVFLARSLHTLDGRLHAALIA